MTFALKLIRITGVLSLLSCGVIAAEPVTIETENYKEIFSVNQHGKLCQSGIVPKSQQDNFTLSAAVSTFPAEGFEQFAMTPALRVVQADGAHNIELYFDKLETLTNDGKFRSDIFTLSDREYPVSYTLKVDSYPDCDTFVYSMQIHNNGEQPITLINRDSIFLRLPATNAWVANFSGEVAREMRYNADPVPHGITVCRNSAMSHSAVPVNPATMISFNAPFAENEGTVMAALLANSGSWEYKITKNRQKELYFSAGEIPENIYKLAPGTTYHSFPVILTFSDKGKNGASQNLHRFFRKHYLANPERELPIVLNSWESAYFTFDEAKLQRMIDRAAELGVEMFVLDDGWFGNKYPRDNDTAGLGDWQVNEKKISSGLNALIDYAEAKNVKFGLWVEPEMVNPASELFHKHPDWVIANENRTHILSRNQLLLDLSNPEVEEFVYNTVSSLLRQYPKIAYIKWDHNAMPMREGSRTLKDNQAAQAKAITDAYYRILEKLRNEFPNVIFQLCASGGGRVDSGAMKYHDEFWPSDNTDPLARVLIQWGYSHFYPNMQMVSHLSKFHPGGTKMKIDVALCGRLGVELNPDEVPEADRTKIKNGIALYKRLRPLLQEAVIYRGLSPYESNVNTFTMVAPDRKHALFFAFRRGGNNLPERYLLSGLNPDATYLVTEVNCGDNQQFATATMTGKELMAQGIAIIFPNTQETPEWEVAPHHSDLFAMPAGAAKLGSTVLEVTEQP